MARGLMTIDQIPTFHFVHNIQPIVLNIFKEKNYISYSSDEVNVVPLIF